MFNSNYSEEIRLKILYCFQDMDVMTRQISSNSNYLKWSAVRPAGMSGQWRGKEEEEGSTLERLSWPKRGGGGGGGGGEGWGQESQPSWPGGWSEEGSLPVTEGGWEGGGPQFSTLGPLMTHSFSTHWTCILYVLALSMLLLLLHANS